MKAIIIGASSGIGKALAQKFSDNGYILGLTARRENLLHDLKNHLKQKSFIKKMDVTKAEDSIKILNDLIQEMNGVDLIIINAGFGKTNPELDWEIIKQTINVNVLGFAAIAAESYKYFSKKGSGHIVGISSIASLGPSDHTPTYPASKAFDSMFLYGLKLKNYIDKKNIFITDIRPGFVDTDMVKGRKMIWCSSVEKASKQIFKAILKKKQVAYITKRWFLIALLFKFLPFSLYKKMRKILFP
ncbi:MAG: SDR family NAD(P)-dependent oxidoreductase [Parachlamydiales bacterium]|nr:SDR family NAD(P)-dependent oxidoreductase [Parachlamydiales bacterium]